VWQEAAELRRSGALLELGRTIRCPVVAIHDDYDPHPAEGISTPISRIVKDFRFLLLETVDIIPGTRRRRESHFSRSLSRR
jgi:hypothetical protein